MIKLLYAGSEKRPAGFIEYLPGDQCWRAVDAKGYLFIHCIWISANKNKNQGFGSRLVQECVRDAEQGNYSGVAVMASEGPFMAHRELFLKNGFRIAASDKPFDLLAKKFRKDSPDPCFMDWRTKLNQYNGLHIIYSNQCPWVSRFIQELADNLTEKGISVTVKEFSTPAEAQSAPSPYAVFNLVYNGRLLADHYISETRLMNILKKIELIP